MSVLKVYSEVDSNNLEVFKLFEDIKDDSTQDEARLFIDGQGLFCIHENSKVYAMLCTKED